jgi:hypothetical protein
MSCVIFWVVLRRMVFNSRRTTQKVTHDNSKFTYFLGNELYKSVLYVGLYICILDTSKNIFVR